MTACKENSRDPHAERSAGSAMIPAPDWSPWRAGADVGFAPLDLLNDFAFLTARLDVEIRDRHWLDAYLLAVGAGQVVDDHLHRNGTTLRRGANYFGSGHGRPGLMAASVAGLSSTGLVRSREILPGTRRLVRYRRALSELIDELACSALDLDAAATPDCLTRIERTLAVCTGLEVDVPGAVRRDVLRLPACFRDFDQHPLDVVALAAAFAEGWTHRDRSLLLVGVRTSGSYLAPLCAAALRRFGYADVRVTALRPGEPLMRHERAQVAAVARNGGLVLLLDDPPITGSSISRVAAQLNHVGLPSSSTVLLLSACETSPRVPPALNDYPRVVLAWPDWHVAGSLHPDRVARILEPMVSPGVRVTRVSPLGDLVPVRGHVRASFTVELLDPATGGASTYHLVAEGTGLGYLGRHAAAVARALPGLVPRVVGFADGLLFHVAAPDGEATAGERRWDGPEPAERVVAYVAARHRAFPATADHSVRLAGRQPAWEVAAALLCASLSRLGIPLRIPLVDPVVHRLLAVGDPSVVDGRMYPWHWRRAGLDGHEDRQIMLVKEKFADGAFSNRELYSYDPIFDLAGAAVATGDDVFSARLRERYEARSGRPVPEERWLLHQLVHLWDAARENRLPIAETRRESARAVQRYFAAVFLADLDADPQGPFCALDIDGVLETSVLGYPATTRAGALALRALRAHGYRPLLATGRNLDDVRDRCETYRLCGGVAEYGAFVYDHVSGRVIEGGSAQGQQDLDRLRDELSRLPDVEIDPGHRLTLRAYRGPQTRRRGLERRCALAAMAAAGVVGRVRLIPGDDQTDFVPAGIDKATGLRVFLDSPPAPTMTAGPPGSLALAVGDGPADAGMLELADLGFAPANAAPVLRSRGIDVLGRPNQAGLAAAVGVLIGHRPGGCDLCRPPVLSTDARRLLALLSVPETGRSGLPRQLLRLTLLAADARWRP